MVLFINLICIIFQNVDVLFARFRFIHTCLLRDNLRLWMHQFLNRAAKDDIFQCRESFLQSIF